MTNQVAKTREGVKWSVLDQVAKQLVTLLIAAVLSRLVSPAEFGLLAMITLAIGFLQVLKDMGLGASLIYKQDPGSAELSTIFWVNVLVGIFLFVLLFFMAPVMAQFFEQPELVLLVRVMAIGFLFSSLSIVPEALLQKSMNFKALFFRNLIAVVLSGLIGMLLAWQGWGVWALVAQSVLLAFFNLLINFFLSGWKPQWVFEQQSLRSHFRYSLPLFTDSSINFWVRNIDNLLVGKLLGAVSLGMYSKAYSLMLLPVRQLSMTFSRVLFPSFAMIQDKTDIIWDQFSRLSASIACLSFGFMICLGNYADWVILLVYGRQWGAVVPIFRVLCLLGAIQSLASLAGSIYAAKGKTVLMLKVGLFSKSFMILAIVVGITQYGLMGMVWSYVAAGSIAFFFELYFLLRVLQKNMSAYFTVMVPELLSGMLLLLFFFISRFIFPHPENEMSAASIAGNLLELLLGLSCYLLALRVFRSKGLNLLLAQVYGKRDPGTAPNAR